MWDDTVAVNPEAKIIGYIAMVRTENETEDPQDNVPDEFREYLDIMSKETADTILEHKSYNCQIELKEGEKAPWGPIYPLSENELEILRGWLQEMLKTGKIC